MYQYMLCIASFCVASHQCAVHDCNAKEALASSVAEAVRCCHNGVHAAS